MESAVTERTPPATWPEFWRDLASRAGRRLRGLLATDQPAWARPVLLVITRRRPGRTRGGPLAR